MNSRSLFSDGRQLLKTLVARMFDRRPSILVLHDIDGWALDHVFQLWFGDSCNFRVARLNWDKVSTPRAFQGHNLVVYGYLDIYLRFKSCPRKAVVIIHDPCELFPQVVNWHEVEPKPELIVLLRSLRAVVVISIELQTRLSSYGIKTYRIPTMSRLPVQEDCELTPLPPVAISIFKNYPRKNAEMLNRLAEKGRASGLWNLSLHENPSFNETAYLDLIDQSPIYVCSSWQEGGPLPAMDVMSRGGVVVTTRVGQMEEIITDGESGFFCSSQEEFEETLARLFGNRNVLEQARGKSLAAYRQRRDKAIIRETVQQVFTNILRHP
ncbi:glycosyl transferase family 1 [Prosthecobacter fusiformis]|uniref:Glycosyl transferase family 1 n=1 Tax=Prosthecobacter fusiformis TaxID=48464 RepID=A0A4R7RZI2_9BACT|nr:glycosyl transferase family 1 [Prosthecobacter fusiformis]